MGSRSARGRQARVAGLKPRKTKRVSFFLGITTPTPSLLTTVDRTAGQARYQSGIAHTLTISGQKFCEGAAADISLAFDPPLTKDADYQVLKVTAKDGVCDDARVKGPCALGTDCQDQCGNQPVRQAGLEVLFTILAASTQRESAMRPRTRRRRLTHPNV